MNMIRLIAWREYMENVRTKGFWVTILIIPVIFIGLLAMQLFRFYKSGVVTFLDMFYVFLPLWAVLLVNRMSHRN